MSQNFIFLAAMFGFMYFLLIRPQKKKMENRKRMMENLTREILFQLSWNKRKNYFSYGRLCNA
jgi:uncharacterized protein (DUF1800 family)